jgi:uncharacterized OB-fold protein
MSKLQGKVTPNKAMAGTGTSRAIDPNLFVWPADHPALLGSCCADCGRISFPASAGCRYCGGTQTERVTLPRRGRLWTWTLQRFMPKAPYRSSETEATFRPFGLGYVELADTVRVEARLTENDPARLRIGDEVELVFYAHCLDADGTQVMNYAFQPRSAGQ